MIGVTISAVGVDITVGSTCCLGSSTIGNSFDIAAFSNGTLFSIIVFGSCAITIFSSNSSVGSICTFGITGTISSKVIFWFVFTISSGVGVTSIFCSGNIASDEAYVSTFDSNTSSLLPTNCISSGSSFILEVFFIKKLGSVIFASISSFLGSVKKFGYWSIFSSNKSELTILILSIILKSTNSISLFTSPENTCLKYENTWRLSDSVSHLNNKYWSFKNETLPI